ncbi:hypothetical protein [Croceicoccus marinus]|jgi:hypothetical protein|uniref:Uncharacterized protein n=1 Tax=Croceicoccus marinus TaxID=450378 RepID=A0A7G6VXH2_9SPHN|nr:hypothetical protein [Croceicoccus marinus]QNE06437.1 hypothetical protein H4O24_07585 [Croceicoccus marinus]
MEGFVLDLNKRETVDIVDTAEPDVAVSAPDIIAPPARPAAEAADEHLPDGIGTFRGLAIGLPIAAGLWAAIIGGVAYVIA